MSSSPPTDKTIATPVPRESSPNSTCQNMASILPPLGPATKDFIAGLCYDFTNMTHSYQYKCEHAFIWISALEKSARLTQSTISITGLFGFLFLFFFLAQTWLRRNVKNNSFPFCIESTNILTNRFLLKMRIIEWLFEYWKWRFPLHQNIRII